MIKEDEQTKKLQEVQEKNIELDLEVKQLTEELSTVKDESTIKENELFAELHSLQEKYSVLSNLLDIVKERADEAEMELEKFRCSSSTHSARSASNVSALSDASLGSDDVFLVPRSPGSTRPEDEVVIDKDWEKQFRKRIGCLEALLAEERSKLLASEKKLKLISTDIVSTGLSDDAKLHLREKELLQEELLESQKHMRIASDQISGLRERMQILEEENLRLKEDYRKLEIEMTASKPSDADQGSNIQRENFESIKKLQEEIFTYKSLIKSLENDCAKFKLQSEEYEYKMNNHKENMEMISVDCKKYKEQAEELEYKVAELNEIWRSKSAASEKEKESIQIRLKNKILDLRSKEDLLLKLQKTLQVKTVSLAEKERIIKAKEAAISTRDEVIRGLEEISKQRDNDFQALIEQVSNQDENAKKLRESLRQRDERLREKDDMLQKLNNNIGLKQDEVKNLDNAVRDSITRLSQKEEELKKLRTHISEVENMKTMSETDEQKENTALKNKFTELLISVKRLTDDKEKLSRDLSIMKNNLNDKESKSIEEKNVLQMKIRTLNERLTNVTKTAMMNEKDSMRILRQDNQNMIEEKNRLNCEIRNLRQEMDEKQKLLDSQADIAQALESKRKQVEELAAINKRQQESIDRLESQATLAFQLQQEERVRKAEQLAMKVRYETKIEKLQRDYNQLLINSERVAKERELQQEIIRGVQRGMFNLKDKYTQDRSRWQTDKEKFENQATEAEKGQNEANQLKSEVEKLRMKIEDQERKLLEQANKFATEKSALEINYSSVLSEKNQLENQMATISKSSEGEMMSKKVWEKERSEQKRLLTEAHNLAMDLQQQLKTRDEAYSKERKQLMNRLESERDTWEKKKIELEKKLAALESSGRQLDELKIKYQDLEDTTVKDQQNWLIEKNELVRQLTEQRQRLLKDSRKIEDLLYQLNHIKSLMEPDNKTSEGEINANIVSRSSKHFSQTIPANMPEVSIVLNTMTDDLIRYIDTKDREVQSQVRRSLSSTQLELHKELENVLGTDTSSGLLSPVSAGNGITRSHTSDALQKMTVTTSSTDLLSPQLTMSYNTSHTKSRSPSPSRISKQKPHSVSVSGSQAASSLSGELPKNKTLIKSISMDNQEVIFSVSSTKTEQKPAKTEPLATTTSATSLNLSTSSTLPRMSTSTTTMSSSSSFQLVSPNLSVPTRSVSTDNVSPMTARKQFFAQQSASDYGMSWPRRGAGFGHSRQMSMPDAGEIRVLTSGVSESKHSVSWNDNVKVVESEKREVTVTSSSTENVLHVKPSGVKEKRRLFKKSSSVDNPVMSSIARVGVQAAQPAAPSIMKPSDLFKAMKQKLRPSFKKTFSFDSNPFKPTGEGSTPTESIQSWGPSASASPEQLSPEILEEPPMSAFHPIQTSSVDREEKNRYEQKKEDKQTQDQKTVHSDEESDRLGRMVTSSRKIAFRKNRSKSADSRHEDRLRPVVVHADVITPIRVWEFNETPV
ncbi:protein CROWDED NUCLEI 4 [Octopus sinensis]|uniref:Protein CROWDED NUCLEI 4 n=1 Tax=Octopus sinensis TaxID=2607531 RepID=A0A6P7S528_9MOLL|nr:protein CROWDED NUCLEI 4 [Octopus sinensis]